MLKRSEENNGSLHDMMKHLQASSFMGKGNYVFYPPKTDKNKGSKMMKKGK